MIRILMPYTTVFLFWFASKYVQGIPC